jgi:hypothetical protein
MKKTPIFRTQVVACVLVMLAGLAGCSKEDNTPLPEPISAPKAAKRKARAEARRAAADEAKAQAEPQAAAPRKAAPPQAAPPPQPSGPPPFTVHVTSEDDLGEAPLTVTLEVDINEGGGTPPYTILWDFGDGSEFSNEKLVKHIYQFPGEFRASAIVHDKNGKIAQDYADVMVEEPWETARPLERHDMTREEAAKKLRDLGQKQEKSE